MSYTTVSCADGREFGMRISKPGEPHAPFAGQDPVVIFYSTNQSGSCHAIATYDLGRFLRPNIDEEKIGSIFASGRELNLQAGVKEWTLDANAMAEMELVLFENGFIDNLESGQNVSGWMEFYSENKSDLPELPEEPIDKPKNAAEWADYYGIEVSTEIPISSNAKSVVITNNGELRIYNTPETNEPRTRIAVFTLGSKPEESIVEHEIQPE